MPFWSARTKAISTRGLEANGSLGTGHNGFVAALPGFNSAPVPDVMTRGRRVSAPDEGRWRIGSANDDGRIPNLLMTNEKRGGLQRAI